LFLELRITGRLYCDGKVDNANNNSNGNHIDKLIKLGQAEKLMREVISPVPSRPTLISYIKNGVLSGKRIFNSYYIYESSLQEFIEKNKKEVSKNRK
jgi:hypothetical protein